MPLKFVLMSACLGFFFGCGLLPDTSCPKSQSLPPTALNVEKSGLGSYALSMTATARDVDNAGGVVGYVDLDARSGVKPYGFYVNASGSAKVELRTTQGLPFIPLAMNDSGLVAGFASLGEFESVQNSASPFGASYKPVIAAIIKTDGTGYHQFDSAGKIFSRAVGLSPHGVAGGIYSPSADSLHACLFNYQDTQFVDLHVPGALYSSVADLNDSWILVNADFSAERKCYLIRMAPPWERTEVPASLGKGITLTAINQKNQVVGFWTDSATNVDHGVFFSASDFSAATFPVSIVQDGYAYSGFLPMGLNDDGLVVGRVQRDGHSSIESRAFLWYSDKNIFHDVTPTSDNYGEAYQINNGGTAVGYAGFWNGDCSIINRAFAEPVK